MKYCDVLIVGGGPAGLSVASELSADIKAIIVHQDAEIGRPVRTSGGSFLSDMQALKIPEDLYQVIDRLDIFSDNEIAKFQVTSDKMVILDITRLYQYLANLSDQKPNEIRLSEKFLNTEIQSDGRYQSTIRSRENGDEIIASKYIVDASGWHCAVIDALGYKVKPERLGVGTEFEFVQDDFESDRAILFVGSNVLSGYGWVFPTNYGTVRLGVGVIKPDTNNNPRDVMENLLKSGFLNKLGVKVPDDYEVNSGVIPSIPFDSKSVYGNVIRVGDAANCATPVAGEGIRIAIEQGRLLGQALTRKISQNKSDALHDFERAYAKKYKRDYKIGFWANQRISYYKPDDWDKSVARIKGFSENQIVSVLRSKFDAKAVAKTILIHLKRKVFGK